MADNSRISVQTLSLEEIAHYHEDTLSSLRFYFTEMSSFSADRFLGYTPTERADELKRHIDETALRSILIILASLEASFRVDYEDRRQKKFKRDTLSRDFRAIYREKEERVSLDQDIFEAWKTHFIDSKYLIAELRSAFKLRHWLAHGRYWRPKIGKQFDYYSVYDLAVAVNKEFFGDESGNP